MKWLGKGTALVLCGALLLAPTVSARTLITETESGTTAEEMMLPVTPTVFEEALPTVSSPSELNVGGKSAVLMDQATGTILFEKNAHEHLPIASVTKVMTLLLVMEALDDGTVTLDDKVTCSPEAASMGGSQIWLEAGEMMTVHELLKAAAVVSANDACAALAEHVAGSIEEFVRQMNVRAAELGMKDTLFLDCSGLNDEAYSCAHDVAVMSRQLMMHPLITRYTTIWMDTLRDGKSQLVNTNKLVRFYAGVTGLKTGTTSAAGHNLSATAARGGLALVAVILGCETTDERFGGARKLLDHGFAQYASYTPYLDPALLTPIPVLRGVASSVEVEAGALLPLLVKKGEEKRIVCEVTMDTDVEAPVAAGQIVGTLAVKKDGELLREYPIVTKSDVRRLGFGDAFGRLWGALCA